MEENQKLHEEGKTVGEANNSAKESRTPKEDEEISDASVEPHDPVHFMGKSNPLTGDSTHLDLADSGMKEEEECIVEFSNNTSGATLEAAEQTNLPPLNKPDGMILQVPEDSMTETEETKVLVRKLDDHNDFAGSDTAKLNSQGILEGMKSSAPNEDSGVTSSDSDLDSRYTFDAFPPVSADVEEP